MGKVLETENQRAKLGWGIHGACLGWFHTSQANNLFWQAPEIGSTSSASIFQRWNSAIGDECSAENKKKFKTSNPRLKYMGMRKRIKAGSGTDIGFWGTRKVIMKIGRRKWGIYLKQDKDLKYLRTELSLREAKELIKIFVKTVKYCCGAKENLHFICLWGSGCDTHICARK